MDCPSGWVCCASFAVHANKTLRAFAVCVNDLSGLCCASLTVKSPNTVLDWSVLMTHCQNSCKVLKFAQHR